MTNEKPPTDRFEERLLAELRAHVAQRAADAPQGDPHGGRRARGLVRPPRLVLAGVGVAAAAAIVAVSTGGDGAPPAYAVEPQGDGSVTVTIRSLQDADGLERQLRDAGVPAEVEHLGGGMLCQAATPARAATGGGISGTAQRASDGATEFTIDPGELKSDERLLISTSTTDAPGGAGASSAVAVAVVDAADAGCDPVPAPGTATELTPATPAPSAD